MLFVVLWRCFEADLLPCCWLLCGGFVTMLLVALWRNQTDTGLHAGDHDLRVPEPLLGRWAVVVQQQPRQRQL